MFDLFARIHSPAVTSFIRVSLLHLALSVRLIDCISDYVIFLLVRCCPVLYSSSPVVVAVGGEAVSFRHTSREVRPRPNRARSHASRCHLCRRCFLHRAQAFIVCLCGLNLVVKKPEVAPALGSRVVDHHLPLAGRRAPVHAFVLGRCLSRTRCPGLLSRWRWLGREAAAAVTVPAARRDDAAAGRPASPDR
eukprot:COSAG06_NODE_6265_length_3006_cov_52.689714_2_plen_192_part_00